MVVHERHWCPTGGEESLVLILITGQKLEARIGRIGCRDACWALEYAHVLAYVHHADDLTVYAGSKCRRKDFVARVVIVVTVKQHELSRWRDHGGIVRDRGGRGWLRNASPRHLDCVHSAQRRAEWDAKAATNRLEHGRCTISGLYRYHAGVRSS